MNITTGRIYDEGQMKDFRKLLEQGEMTQDEFNEYREMKIPPMQIQLARNPARVARNEPCPCGSGKKFKKCCLVK